MPPPTTKSSTGGLPSASPARGSALRPTTNLRPTTPRQMSWTKPHSPMKRPMLMHSTKLTRTTAQRTTAHLMHLKRPWTMAHPMRLRQARRTARSKRWTYRMMGPGSGCQAAVRPEPRRRPVWALRSVAAWRSAVQRPRPCCRWRRPPPCSDRPPAWGRPPPPWCWSAVE